MPLKQQGAEQQQPNPQPPTDRNALRSQCLLTVQHTPYRSRTPQRKIHDCRYKTSSEVTVSILFRASTHLNLLFTVFEWKNALAIEFKRHEKVLNEFKLSEATCRCKGCPPTQWLDTFLHLLF